MVRQRQSLATAQKFDFLDGGIDFYFGHISKLKYAHFLKKMGILQMGIFKNFQKNGHIANGHIFINYQKMGIL